MFLEDRSSACEKIALQNCQLRAVSMDQPTLAHTSRALVLLTKLTSTTIMSVGVPDHCNMNLHGCYRSWILTKLSPNNSTLATANPVCTIVGTSSTLEIDVAPVADGVHPPGQSHHIRVVQKLFPIDRPPHPHPILDG